MSSPPSVASGQPPEAPADATTAPLPASSETLGEGAVPAMQALPAGQAPFFFVPSNMANMAPVAMQPQGPGQLVMQPQGGGPMLMQPAGGAQVVLQPQVGEQLVMQPQAGTQMVMQPAAGGQLVMQPQAGGQMVLQPQAGGQMVMQPAAAGQMVMQPAAGGQMVMQPAGGAVATMQSPGGMMQPAGPVFFCMMPPTMATTGSTGGVAGAPQFMVPMFAPSAMPASFQRPTLMAAGGTPFAMAPMPMFAMAPAFRHTSGQQSSRPAALGQLQARAAQLAAAGQSPHATLEEALDASIQQEPTVQKGPVEVGGKTRTYKGVTKHKRTQRYEVHIWLDKRQVYLGAYKSEVQAARGHDIMALASNPAACDLNFPWQDYAGVVPFLAQMSQTEMIAALRTYSKSLTGSKHRGTRTAPRAVKRKRAPVVPPDSEEGEEEAAASEGATTTAAAAGAAAAAAASEHEEVADGGGSGAEASQASAGTTPVGSGSWAAAKRRRPAAAVPAATATEEGGEAEAAGDAAAAEVAEVKMEEADAHEQAAPAGSVGHASSGSEQMPGAAAPEQAPQAVDGEMAGEVKQEAAVGVEKTVEGEDETDARADGQVQSSGSEDEDGSGGEGDEDEVEDEEGGAGADLLLLLAEEAQREAYSGRRANGRPLRDSSNKRRAARVGRVESAPAPTAAAEAAVGPADAGATRKRPVRKASKGVMAWKQQQ